MENAPQNPKKPQPHIEHHRGNLKFMDTEDLEWVFDIFGLTDAERKIIIATAASSRKESTIMRVTGESRATVRKAIKNLEQRTIVKRDTEHVGYAPTEEPKTPHWTSDLRRILKRLKVLRS